MAKIFNFYTKNNENIDLDRTWYDSSTIKYSECLDRDNELKTLIVVFSNGTKYRYDDVNVNDYLLFREGTSVGKALNQYIKAKGYSYEKLDNADLSILDGELSFRQNGGLFIKNDEDGYKLINSIDKVIYEESEKADEKTIELIVGSLKSIGKEIKIL